MSDREEEDYAICLETGLHILCAAMGVDSEKYDVDKSDIENYLDCFRDAAEIIKRAIV